MYAAVFDLLSATPRRCSALTRRHWQPAQHAAIVRHHDSTAYYSVSVHRWQGSRSSQAPPYYPYLSYYSHGSSLRVLSLRVGPTVLAVSPGP